MTIPRTWTACETHRFDFSGQLGIHDGFKCLEWMPPNLETQEIDFPFDCNDIGSAYNQFRLSLKCWLNWTHELEREFCAVQWHLVSVSTFGVMYDHTLFYACKSPEQSSDHTEAGCQPGDYRWPLNIPQGCEYMWVNILTLPSLQSY